MVGKTQDNGSKTRRHTRHSPLSITGKHPDFDYSFRRKKDIEEGGGQDMYGYEPVANGNSNGETWDGPKALRGKGGARTFNYVDTQLCRRPKEVSKYFKSMEDEKYNAQVDLVRNASKNASAKFRQVDPDGVYGMDVQSDSVIDSRALKQRTGPTEEEVND